MADADARDLAYSTWIARIVELALREGLHEQLPPRVRDAPEQGALLDRASGM